MDCRFVLIFCLAVLVSMISFAEGRTKKVVIHVPYKVKKIKHVHTVYRSMHHPHHYGFHETAHHGGSANEEHEHFHHMHIHEESPVGQHTQPVVGIGIPDFLPDVPLDVNLDMPDVPELQALSNRHPMFRLT